MTTRLVRGARETVLWTGALLGLLAIAAGLAVVVAGASFLVFRSGSMSPEIPTGALALATPARAADIRPGDVVSVHSSEGSLITHRVVSTTVRGDEASLVLQGDANSTPDVEPYVVEQVDRVRWSVPYAGYAVAFALTPAGLMGIAAVCVALFFVPPGRGEVVAPPGGTNGGRHRAGRRSVVAATLVAASVAGSGVTGTQATFTDAATQVSGSFAARTLDPPTGVACSDQFLASDYIAWTAPAGPAPTGYKVYYSTSPSGPFTTADVAATPLRWQPPNPTPYVTYYVYVAANRGSWSSVPSVAGDTIRATSIIGINYFSCT